MSVKLKRALTVQDILNKKFKTLPFEGKWLESFGEPELSGTAIIYGGVKNGKTSFAMQFAKYLSRFSVVCYNSVEEKAKKSFQSALIRNNMKEAGTKVLFVENETLETLTVRLSRKKSPKVVVIDTVQFWDFNAVGYMQLKERFKNKLFIYISHVQNGLPKGETAMTIYRDSDMICHVEGFRMFPTSRYGGGVRMDVNKELADKWHLRFSKDKRDEE